jgi:hypothetical protein
VRARAPLVPSLACRLQRPAPWDPAPVDPSSSPSSPPPHTHLRRGQQAQVVAARPAAAPQRRHRHVPRDLWAARGPTGARKQRSNGDRFVAGSALQRGATLRRRAAPAAAPRPAHLPARRGAQRGSQAGAQRPRQRACATGCTGAAAASEWPDGAPVAALLAPVSPTAEACTDFHAWVCSRPAATECPGTPRHDTTRRDATAAHHPWCRPAARPPPRPAACQPRAVSPPAAGPRQRPRTPRTRPCTAEAHVKRWRAVRTAQVWGPLPRRRGTAERRSRQGPRGATHPRPPAPPTAALAPPTASATSATSSPQPSATSS